MNINNKILKNYPSFFIKNQAICSIDCYILKMIRLNLVKYLIKIYILIRIHKQRRMI